MKNLSINKWFVLLFLFSFSSCEELLLDKKPLVGTTLDNFYQTFYISKVPLFSYNFKYYLENIKLGSKRIKI